MIFKVIISLLFLSHLTNAKSVRVGRIASGSNAVATENLDYAYLDIVFQNQAQRCGASLISPEYLLTSATCVFDPVEGVATRVNITFPRIKEINTSFKIFIHPGYNAESHVNDLAAIKLTKRVVPDGKTLTLAILGVNPTPDFYKDKILRGCGMGSIANAPTPPKTLQCTNLYGVAATVCSTNPNIICTQWPDRDNNFCNGDYGGPIYINTYDTGSLVQTVVGIANSSPDRRPNAPCYDGHKVSYAQVGAYLPWIEATLSEVVIQKCRKTNAGIKYNKNFVLNMLKLA